MTIDDGFGDIHSPAAVIFGDGRCACPSTRDLVAAAMHGQELEPACTLHQSEAIEARKVTRQREEAFEREARLKIVIDDLREQTDNAGRSDGFPRCTCGDTKTDLLAAFSGRPVSECALHRISQGDVGTQIPLGSDALTQSLMAKLPGATLHDPTTDL